jgi:hypothetical protein
MPEPTNPGIDDEEPGKDPKPHADPEHPGSERHADATRPGGPRHHGSEWERVENENAENADESRDNVPAPTPP